MKKLAQLTVVLPIILIIAYIGLFFFINLQEYADIYSVLQKIDNLLVLSMLLGYAAGGSEIWNETAIKSFWTVVILNIVTEINLPNYYEIYKSIISLFLLTMIIVNIPPIKREFTL